MSDQFKPGTEIKITVTAEPNTKRAEETIRRLMRLNTETQRTLRLAQRHRDRITVRRIRAGNLWHQRPRVARVVNARPGNTWTMRYRPQIANDLQSVSRFVSVEAV